jgi:halimadienyl-diphosphate synthase
MNGQAEEISKLLTESSQDDWALITPSLYETARLVSMAPWLSGHEERLAYLCSEQGADGGWGVSGFRLVPTLSATEALLATCAQPVSAKSPVTRATLAKAALRGLDWLRRWQYGPQSARALPDTVAIELIVPRLIDGINAQRTRHAKAQDPILPLPVLAVPLEQPEHTVPEVLQWLRQQARLGRPIPAKLWHTWETLTPGSVRPAEVPLVAGAVSCSPAATAAWLGGPHAADHPAVRFLDGLQRRGGGPVPVATPMPFFERAWMLSILASRGIPHTVPAGMLASLRDALAEDGIGAGPGLAPDADDTAVTLHALALNGHDLPLDSLMGYFDSDHFRCYPEERTASPTTNAHALQALVCRLARHPEDRGRYEAAAAKTAAWLREVQGAEGSWSDKWHGSPYYATACCAQALADHGAAADQVSVERAVSWVLDSQHASELWGHEKGTVEETAYAAWTLALSRSPELAARARAGLMAAQRILREGVISAASTTLWIGKDVYTPIRIAQVTRLAALHCLERISPLNSSAERNDGRDVER